jgi:hypothetical protein
MREPYPSGLYSSLGNKGLPGRQCFGGEPPPLQLLSCGETLHMRALSCYTKS